MATAWTMVSSIHMTTTRDIKQGTRHIIEIVHEFSIPAFTDKHGKKEGNRNSTTLP